jgi:hypothetical protein
MDTADHLAGRRPRIVAHRKQEMRIVPEVVNLGPQFPLSHMGIEPAVQDDPSADRPR